MNLSQQAFYTGIEQEQTQSMSQKAFMEGISCDDLKEHRGAPDPAKAAERERMKASGKIRHKNAIERRKKAEEARRRKRARRAATATAVKTKVKTPTTSKKKSVSLFHKIFG